MDDYIRDLVVTLIEAALDEGHPISINPDNFDLLGRPFKHLNDVYLGEIGLRYEELTGFDCADFCNLTKDMMLAAFLYEFVRLKDIKIAA